MVTKNEAKAKGTSRRSTGRRSFVSRAQEARRKGASGALTTAEREELTALKARGEDAGHGARYLEKATAFFAKGEVAVEGRRRSHDRHL